MKYYLYDDEHNCRGTARSINAALQAFGEMRDAFPEASKDWTVEIYLEIKPRVEKFYNVYYLPDFLNKSPEFFDATPEQEDEHYIKSTPDKLCMTEAQFKAYNAGNDKRIDEMAQGFTDEEMATIIKYVPTGFIIGELARRLQEYDNATNEIQNTLSNMKIYQSDKKGILKLWLQEEIRQQRQKPRPMN